MEETHTNGAIENGETKTGAEPGDELRSSRAKYRSPKPKHRGNWSGELNENSTIIYIADEVPTEDELALIAGGTAAKVKPYGAIPVDPPKADLIVINGYGNSHSPEMTKMYIQDMRRRFPKTPIFAVADMQDSHNYLMADRFFSWEAIDAKPNLIAAKFVEGPRERTL